jgi:hypothetical protein
LFLGVISAAVSTLSERPLSRVFSTRGYDETPSPLQAAAEVIEELPPEFQGESALNVPSMFPQCSLNVPSMFLEFFLSAP